MLKLNVKNRYTYLQDASIKTITLLQEVTSYQVTGSWFSKAFQDKNWDGKEKLLKRSEKNGYFFPTGLLKDVVEFLKTNKIKFKLNTKNRRMPKSREQILYSWNKNIKLRPYQIKAYKAITKKGVDYGSGILKMPIRSGKTKTVAWIIGFLSVKTLMIVPSKLLLYQSIESLKDSLLCDVGIIGDGKWTEENLTVATAQTLSRARINNDERFKKLVKDYNCVVFDEVHHMTAETWHDTMMAFDAPYKIGLSATAFVEKGSKDWEKGSIWLKACCGRIRIDISMSELIQQGYLMRPEIRLYKITKPDGLEEKGWSQELRNKCIYENKHRNRKIIKLAKDYLELDLDILIVSNRLNQVDILSTMLDTSQKPYTFEIAHHTITSKDNPAKRKTKIKDFVDKKVNILIGTVLSEGVDIPSTDIVIVADGGADAKATIQKMRNLTISKDKKTVHVIDFLDFQNQYFAGHSRERLKVYRSEEYFNIKVFDK